MSDIETRLQRKHTKMIRRAQWDRRLDSASTIALFLALGIGMGLAVLVVASMG